MPKKKKENPLQGNPEYEKYMQEYRKKMKRLRYEASSDYMETPPPPSED